MWTILKLLGMIQPNYWGGYIPLSPLVSAPLPLKTCCSEEIRRLLKTGPGIDIYDIAERLGNAYLRTQTGAIAVSRFKCTGIYPLNRNIFTDADFAEDEQSHVQVLGTSNNVKQSQDTNETSELLEAYLTPMISLEFMQTNLSLMRLQLILPCQISKLFTLFSASST